MTLQLSSLTIYPVKSCGGISLTECELEARGLKHDRRWMVVDENGKFLSQRSHPQMVLIQPEIKDGSLWLSHPKLDPICVPQATGVHKEVIIWRDTVNALTLNTEIDQWLAKALGCHCLLVFMPDQEIRQCNLDYARPGEQTGFADAYPLLLISQASLDDLNSRLGSPVEMKRFRPNLVVTGCSAFAEDYWSTFSIGSIQMRGVKLCDRCPVPTVNPETGIKESQEPIKTLMKYRLIKNKVYFGQNIVHKQQGLMRIGDVVAVKETRIKPITIA